MTNEEAIALGAHCHICPLRGNTIVPPAPAKRKLRLVVVGEGPGRNEEKMGAPFVGMSGKLLDSALESIGVDRDECHITNAALCRGDSDRDNRRGVECCAPRLLHELRGENVPLVTLGAAALRSVLALRSILVARGFIFTAKEVEPSHTKKLFRDAAKAPEKKRADATLKAETAAGRAHLAGRRVLPLLHPAFILRADTWAPLWHIDWKRVGKVLRGELPQGTEEDNGAHRVGGLEMLDGLSEIVSLDVETDGVKPLECGLLCVGLSDGVTTRVIWPWKSRYAKRLARWLKGRRAVVGHNLFNFDLLVLRAHGVVW